MSFDLQVTDEAICLDKQPGDPTAKVVKCSSPEAAFQMVAKGSPISADDAKRLGIKTTSAELAGWTLLIDSHTIARTPEDKAYAMTQPQPGLVRARAEQIRSAAAVAVASLTTADQAKSLEAAEESKKTDEASTKKLKADLENKADKPAKASEDKAEKKPRKSKKTG